MKTEGAQIFGGGKIWLQETDGALTAFGGLIVFLEFLNKIGFVRKVMECMPIQHHSPNSIPPAQTYVAFLISVAAGARRFAQTSWLRGDLALHNLLGIQRFPSDDTIRNLFLRFGMGEVQRFFEPLTEWMMERVRKAIASIWIPRCLNGTENSRRVRRKATIHDGPPD
jgi:hypothetical protein